MALSSTERACDRCRDRRVKCDKRHPSCLRCEKLGKPCPGYDKKRKFVDEGESLRRKYQASFQPEGTSVGTLVIDSPALGSTAHGTKLGERSTPEVVADLPTRTAQSLDRLPLQAIPLTSDTPALGLADTLQPKSILIPEEVSEQEWIDEIFDPDWFNLDPTETYAQGVDSCGFIPHIPNIADEVDKPYPSMYSNMEAIGTPESTHTLMDTSTWVSEAQWNTSAIIRDEREHEMAYLIRHFTDYIGPWMDLFNQDRHFEQLVPLKALRDALLRNSIAAVAAKQLARVRNFRSFASNHQNQEPAVMETLDGDKQINWYYKAANYYDKAIAFSRIYLQALSGSLSEASTPNTSNTLSVANSDDLLVAVSLFSLYESMDCTNTSWLQHLTGLKSLLVTIHNQPYSSLMVPNITAGREAAFWNFVRADYQSAYIQCQATLLDVEDFHLWRQYGLQIQQNGTLYDDPEGVRTDRVKVMAMTQMVSHTLLWLVLSVVNYISDGNASTSERQATWDRLTRQMDEWRAHLPSTFEPCAQFSRPLCIQSGPQRGLQIKEVFFSVHQCAAAMHLYHFARILLLLNKPDVSDSAGRLQAYRKVINDANRHAQEIMGIALGRPHPAVRVEMVLPLRMSGTCVEDEDEREVVLRLLKAIERDTGCSAEASVQFLKKEWSWSADIAV